MSRATNAVARRRRRRRVHKEAKGFWGDRKNHAAITRDAVMRSMAFRYAHAKKKKGDFRSLWIQRLNVAARINGLSYSRLIDGLKKANCLLDRKVLSEMAIHDPQGFEAVANRAKAALTAA